MTETFHDCISMLQLVQFPSVAKEEIQHSCDFFIITSLQPQGIHAVKYDVPKPDLGEIMNVTMVMPRMLFWFFVSTLLLWSFVVKMLLTMPHNLRHFVMNISNVNILKRKGILPVDIYNLG